MLIEPRQPKYPWGLQARESRAAGLGERRRDRQQRHRGDEIGAARDVALLTGVPQPFA